MAVLIGVALAYVLGSRSRPPTPEPPSSRDARPAGAPGPDPVRASADDDAA
jgi:hypothetical protein